MVKIKRIKKNTNSTYNNKKDSKILLTKIRNKRKKHYFVKKLSLVSPLHFTKDSCFYYEIRKITFFNKYIKNWNDCKPKEDELIFLNELIKKYRDEGHSNTKNDFITLAPYFSSIILNLHKIPFIPDEIDRNLFTIIQNNNKAHNISLRKLKELYSLNYTKNLSITAINRRIKNNLNFSYKKISVKTKDLEKMNYKRMSFLFIKILLKVLKLNINPIFIDESKFEIKNNNFKTWILKGDFCPYGAKSNEKKNIILAVGVNRLFYYAISNKNTNSKKFKNFLNELIKYINEKERNEYIVIMDNLTSHCTQEIKKFLEQNQIKALYTVPYESSFNPIELSFRFIKNKIYKNIYMNIKDLKIDIRKILNSDDFKKSLSKNFAETLENYLEFINKNIDLDLNKE
jgi:transposase